MIGKIIGVFKKNFKIILRSKISLLVLLLPILLLVIIGSIYSQNKLKVLKLGIIPSTNNSIDIFEILNFSNSEVDVERTRFQSKFDCISSLKQQEIDFCLKGYSAEGRIRIDVYTDMSKSVLAWRGYALFENFIKSASRDMISKFIGSLVDEVKIFSEKADKLVLVFDNRTGYLEGFQQKIASLESEFSDTEINTSGIENVGKELEQFSSQIDSVSYSLDNFEEELEDYEDILSELEETIFLFEREKNDTVEMFSEVLSESINELDTVSTELHTWLYFPACEENQVLSSDQCSVLLENYNRVNGVEEELRILQDSVDSLRFDFSDVYETISEAKDDISSTRKDLRAIKRRMSSGQENLDSIRDDFIILKNQLESFEEKKSDIMEELDILEEDSENFVAMMDNVSSDLSGMNEKLSEYIEVINPTSASNPIIFSFNGISLSDDSVSQDFSYILVSIIFLVSVMSGLTFLINEKQSSSIVRNSVLPSNPNLIVSYFFTILLIVFIQAFVIVLLFNRFFLGGIINMLSPLTSLVLFILVALSVSLGLLIGSLFNKYENGMIVGVSISGVLMLLSEKFIMPSSLSHFLANLIEYNPFSLLENLLRMSLINMIPFNQLLNVVSVCVLMIIAFLVLAFLGLMFSSDKMVS
jgi:predicted  nucleic acid-binding Zn-ribbon protein/ABC-type polysaccharide/polyol phosphate export permease